MWGVFCARVRPARATLGILAFLVITGLPALTPSSTAAPPQAAGDDATASHHTATPAPTGTADAAIRLADTAAPTQEHELALVCRQAEADSLFWGQARIEQRRRALEAASTPTEEATARIQLAGALLLQGHPREGLEHLQRAGELAEAAGRKRQMQDLLMARALAHLQLAEDQNCVEDHGAASCVVPFQSDALHRKPQHTRAARDLIHSYLEQRPGDIQAKWLLNLTSQVIGDEAAVPPHHRLPEHAFENDIEFPRFRDRAPLLGLDAVDLAGGAVMEDFDGDGFLDVITSSFHPCHSLRAWRNDGQGGFQEVTRTWGLDGQLGGLNLLQADYDDDGHMDLLVLRGAWLADDGRIPNSLLRNRLADTGRFEDVSRRAGLAEPAYPTQTGAWADYDLDGDLDLFVGNEVRGPALWPASLFRMPGSFDLAKMFDGDDWVDPMRFIAHFLGRPENAYPSQLFRNNGDGTFTDVAEEAGVTNLRFTKGAAWGDYDDDGDPDLFVANGGPNRMYRNEGDGTFTDVAEELGIVEPSRLAFASWFFDWDNDGDLDLFVADYSASIPSVAAFYFGSAMAMSYPVLYRNDGGTFTDISAQVGLMRPILAMGANHGDLDGDGYPDLLVGTGSPSLDSLMPNVALRNRGGESFEDVTFAGGFGHLQKGHGVAFGDLDNDGDQDILHQLGGAFPSDAFANVVYENPGTGHRWVTLQLRGTEANSFGVGARIAVQVVAGEGEEARRRTVHTLVDSGGSFGSSSVQAELGLGDAERIERLTVRWPGSGTVQTFDNLEVDRVYRLVEGQPRAERMALRSVELTGNTALAEDSQPHRHHHDSADGEVASDQRMPAADPAAAAADDEATAPEAPRRSP